MPQAASTAIRDDLDAQLLPVFVEEALGLVQQLASNIRVLRVHPLDNQTARSLTRALHTLKGSARMAGAMRIGELTHAMESRVAATIETTADRSGPESAFGRMLEETETDLDRLADLIEALNTGTPPPAPASPPPPARAEPPSAPALANVARSPASPAGPETAAPPLPAREPPAPPPARTEPARQPFADTFSATAATATLRVDADIIDHLVNEIGEVTIARSRIEGEMATFKQSLLDLTDSLARLRSQLRETQIQADSQMQSRLSQVEAEQGQFDPLELDRYTRLQELTRLMTESLHDVSLVQQALLGNVAETEGAIVQQARVSRDLQQELLRMRSVPLNVINERLYRTVRQTARQLRKRATLEVHGADIELDRSVLRRIAGPLEHMLRNAIAHGIEPADVRLAAGKNEAGRIDITFSQDGSENVITVRDDGAGLDLARVRDEALRKGLLKSGEDVSEPGLRQLIFAPGFSTATELTQTSGRGIGLDVVRSEVSGIGGRVEVESEPGRGTTFSIYLPLSLAQSQVVLVRAGERTHALLSSMVEQVREIPPDELSRLYADGSIPWEGERRPFFYLPRLLGRLDAVADIQRHNSVLVLRSGANRVVVHVDKLMRNQEVVLKNVGPQIARIPGIAGATVLGNGEVVLILNPVQLALQADLAALQSGVRTRVVSEQPPAPTVMVVDDSLTVRRLTGRLLTRAGYQLATAKDGLDALQQLQDSVPDVMLLDLEMPRMDGFELLKRLRSEDRTAALPIIVITSRTADKHRDHALGLGANAFFGKPYQEDELLAECARLLPARRRPVA